MGEAMMSLLGILNTYVFTGLTSNLTYDLLKSSWEEVTKKRWDDIFYEAIKLAFLELRPVISKYGDYTEVDEVMVQRVLKQDLGLNFSNKELTFLKLNEISQKIAEQLAIKNVLVIGGHNLSETDYKQLIYIVLEQAKLIFRDSILANEKAFREMVLRQTEANQSSIDELDQYLRDHHAIFVKFSVEVQSNLKTIISDLDQIKERLGINHTEIEIVQEIKKSGDFATGKMFTEGLCKGYHLSPKPYQYFIAQEYNSNSADLRDAIENALTNFGFKGIRADDVFESGPLLCKIGGLIQSTPFGFYQLSASQNRNVYLELGISIGLEKSFVLIKDKLAEIAPILDGIEYFPINSFLQLQYQLGEKLSPFIANIGRYKHHQSSFLKNYGEFALIFHGNIDSVDFTTPIAKELSKLGLTPIIFGDLERNISYFLEKEGIAKFRIISMGNNTKLDDIISLISYSRCNIFRIDKEASAETFLSLGIAIGQNKDGILFHQNEHSKLPSDLRGLSTIQFTSYSRELPSKISQIMQSL